MSSDAEREDGDEAGVEPSLGEAVAAPRRRPRALRDALQQLDPPEPQDQQHAGQSDTQLAPLIS